MRKIIQSKHFCALLLAAGFCAAAQGASIPFFYTTTSSPDVFSTTYDPATNAVSVPTTPIGYSAQGADGILIGPNSTLFFSGENSNGVFQIPQTGGPALFGTGTTPSFLLAVNQNNPNTVFTFDNAGNVATLPIIAGALQNGTSHAVTGPVTNVSNLVWSASNTAYYITGSPGQTGSLGVFNPGSFSTNSPLFSGLNTAQDAIYDPYTGLILLFGNGQVNTFNPVTGLLGTAVNLPGGTLGGTCPSGTAQFDTGAVDGTGHALATGCGQLYYFDYTATGDILSLSDIRQTTDLGAKDVALLPGTAVPEVSPAGLLLCGLGLLAIGRSRFGKKP